MVITMFVCHATEGFTPLTRIKIEINSWLLFLNLFFFFLKFQAKKSGSSLPVLFDKLLSLSWICSTRKDDSLLIFLCSSLCHLVCTFKTFSSLRLFLSIVTLSTEETPPLYCFSSFFFFLHCPLFREGCGGSSSRLSRHTSRSSITSIILLG